MKTIFRAFIAIDTDPDDVYSDSDSEIDADAPMPQNPDISAIYSYY